MTILRQLTPAPPSQELTVTGGSDWRIDLIIAT
jgi:hypothetical protein